MDPTTPLSTLARRTGDSPISDLMHRALAVPGLISLAAGFVDQATLPSEAAAEAIASMLGDPVEGRRALQYGTTRGDRALRELLLSRLERESGVDSGAFAECLPRLVVTTGSQQLLYLVAEALLDPGDIVLVESPTYFVFMGVLESRGARVIGIETDEGGLRVDRLEERLEALEARGELGRVKLIYTVSEHSNPSGLSLAAERRGALVELAKRWSSKGSRIYILDDAAYRGLTYDGVEPPSVWGHDASGETVIHARTFSKTFSPGLKTGYAVVPEALLGPILHLKGCHDFGSSHFNQQLLARLVEDGFYDRQVERLRATYRRKRDAMLGAMEEHLGSLPGVSWTRPKGGLYVWLTLPEGWDTGRAGRLFERCLERGVLYVPGAYAFAGEPGPVPSNHMRLTYGVADGSAIGEGVERLARAIADGWEGGSRRLGASVARR